VLPAARLLVIDDSSPDGTAEHLARIAAADPEFEYIVRAGKLGLGSAHRRAMQHGWDAGYETLVTMDADLSHQPEQIPRLLAALPGHDFVIGTRSGQGSCDYTGFRRLAFVGGNSMARLLIPTGLTEFTTSMRAFNRSALDLLLTTGERDDGYAYFMEVVYRLNDAGLRLTEVPIDFADRTRGTSKIPRAQIAMSAKVLLQLTGHRLAKKYLGAHTSGR
jgi:dolichol-phosphate mannosyltransferase